MPPSSMENSMPITEESEAFIWTELKCQNNQLVENTETVIIFKCSYFKLLDGSACEKYDTFEFLVVEKEVE